MSWTQLLAGLAGALLVWVVVLLSAIGDRLTEIRNVLIDIRRLWEAR